jgi:hypothetical protein
VCVLVVFKGLPRSFVSIRHRGNCETESGLEQVLPHKFVVFVTPHNGALRPAKSLKHSVVLAVFEHTKLVILAQLAKLMWHLVPGNYSLDSQTRSLWAMLFETSRLRHADLSHIWDTCIASGWFGEVFWTIDVMRHAANCHVCLFSFLSMLSELKH